MGDVPARATFEHTGDDLRGDARTGVRAGATSSGLGDDAPNVMGATSDPAGATSDPAGATSDVREVVVDAVTGSYVGVYDERGVCSFLGVPYATVPGRWELPRALPASTARIDATQDGPACLQDLSHSCWKFAENPEMSEDACLWLNIWTAGEGQGGRHGDRQAEGQAAKRPVLVFIHGGSFFGASARHDCSDGAFYGDALVAAHPEIVFVTIQYRLGIVGSAPLEAFEGGEQYAYASDLMLYDQMAALAWIRENIAAFGGDPDNVTLSGQSAGSWSVFALMSIPRANRFFQRAICSSSAPNDCRVKTPALRAKLSEELKRLTGARSVAELLALPGEVLVEHAGALRRMAPNAFEPCAGGGLMPSHPVKALAEGAARHVSLLCGTTQGEFDSMPPIFGKPADEIRAFVTGMLKLSGRETEVLDAYREHYRDERDEADAYRDLVNDARCRIPVLLCAEAQARAGAPVRMWYITYRSDRSVIRAQHTFEIAYLTGKLDRRIYMDADLIGEPSYSFDPSRELSRQIQDAWAAFVCSGNPNCERIGIDWLLFDPDAPCTAQIDRQWRLLEAVRPLDTAAARFLAQR